MLRSMLAAALGLTTLAACTTTPEPCTAEWVEYKTERVLKSFAASNYGSVRRLKSFADTLEDGNVSPLTAMKIPGMMKDFQKLAASFEDVALPQINAAIDQCGQPERLVPAFTNFLRKEGVGEDVLAWVEVIGNLATENEI